MGVGEYSEQGPIRLGTAFVDRGRCLPWAMNTPCLVCEENCPVTPKAIYTKEMFTTVRNGIYTVGSRDKNMLRVEGYPMKPGEFATGDYFIFQRGSDENAPHWRIVKNKENSFTVDPYKAEGSEFPGEGEEIEVRLHLEAPVVDPEKCIGCGTCEHECPVSGKRAIRVSAENETRNREHSMFLEGN